MSETNPLTAADREARQEAMDSGRNVYWNSPDLKYIFRLRLLSDPGLDFWDVSYCFGTLKDGKHCRVRLPFSQLPKRGLRKAIVGYAKQDGVFARDIGILDNISTLV